MAGEEKTPLKRRPVELPAPHAGCSPGSCQAACSPRLQGLSPAAGKGHFHTPATGESAAQGQEELCVCVAVLGHILQLCCPRRQQPDASLHCEGDIGAAWPHGWRWGRGYCAIRLHRSPWHRAPAAPEQRGEGADNPALLLGSGTLARWEPAASSGLDTFSSCPSPRSGDSLQPQGPPAQSPAQPGAAARGHLAQGRSVGTAGPPQLAGP